MSLLKLSRTICSFIPPPHPAYPRAQLRCFSSAVPQLARTRKGKYPPPGSIAEEFEQDNDPELDDEEGDFDLSSAKVPNLGKLGVRLLEQDLDGKGRRLEGSSDLVHALAAQNKLDSEELDKDIAQLESDISSADQEIQKSFTEEQRNELRERILHASRAGFFRRPHQIEIDGTLSRAAASTLRNFNEAMEAGRMNKNNDEKRLNLWRCYERAKIHVPGFLNMLPKEGWNAIWEIQSQPSPTDANKTSHLKILCEDMIQSGCDLTQSQRFARVEGHFVDENQDGALKLWEEGLKTGDASNHKYVELGITMYSQMGNVKRAEELLDILFKLYTFSDPRIFLPVIFACIRLGSAQGYAQAFGLYLRLRDRLTSDLSMDDYDQISTEFLSAGQNEYALAVFRDMVLAGHSLDTPTKYSSITRAMGTFISLSKDAQEVNRFGLDTLSMVPRRFQNKFFYASWMRKLIAMGKVDEAAQVAELMSRRGVNPDARHMNGLIAAWLRTGHKPSVLKAERFAWSMIQSRLDFVGLRKRKEFADSNTEITKFDLPAKSVYDRSAGAQVPTLHEGPVPPATIETFSILVQWYLRRSKFETVRHLRNLLMPAEISMNSFFMNHLLYAEVRNRTNRDVWNRFEVLSRTVSPDVETFACLWQCMKSHIDPSRNLDPEGFPTPRELFAHMRSWFAGLTGQQLRDARADMETDIYDDIIHCFCLARDLEGSLVALHALKAMWGTTPQPTTIRLLIIQIARLSAPTPLQLGKPSRRKSRKITASKENQDNMAHVSRILELITQNRHEQLLSRGIRFEAMTQDQQAEENHRTVLQLLFAVLQEVNGKSFNAQRAVSDTAHELGVEDIDIELATTLSV